MQHRQSIRCISISVTNPTSHAHIAVLEPIPGALFVGVVVSVVVTSGVDTVTLVISTVLTIVTGPDGPSLTIVLREADVTV